MEVSILLFLAVINDIKENKIKNKVILPFLLLGLITNFIMDGKIGVKNSLIAILIPFLTLFLFYVLGMLGAGDIKFFCAIGSIMGIEFIIYSMAYSFIIGGVIAIIIMLSRKNGIDRFKYFFSYIKGVLLTLSISPYTNFQDKSDGGKFPFAIAIAIGTMGSVIRYFAA